MTRNRRTIQTCPICEERVLRSERFEHPHDVRFPEWNEDAVGLSSDASEDSDDDGEDEEYPDVDDAWMVDGEPMEVGGEYEVTLYYEAQITKRVVATDDHVAKDIAEYDFHSTDVCLTHKVHDEVRQLDTIYADEDAAEEHDLL